MRTLKKFTEPEQITCYLTNDFLHKLINEWNSLFQHVIETSSFDAFKSKLDHLRDPSWQD